MSRVLQTTGSTPRAAAPAAARGLVSQRAAGVPISQTRSAFATGMGFGAFNMAPTTLTASSQRASKKMAVQAVAASDPKAEEAEAAAAKWLAIDTNADTRAEVQKLLDAGEYGELDKRFSSRLQFGTAGLRGLMGAGYSRMNEVTIQQTSQGLCTYYMAESADQLAANGVAIGYDGRHGSRKFAEITAAVFISKGVKVYMFEVLAATPLLAKAVSHLGCAAGVMVTASHNPKEYNGYKVYHGNGCQIIPPHDAGIAAAIEANLDMWDLPAIEGSPLLADPTEEISQVYYAELTEQLNFAPATAKASDPVVYTPLHGVGLPWAERSFAALGLPPFVPVPSQSQPDPEFSTVVFPNPEEGEGTWAKAFETAEAGGVELVLANDPDADRLAAAEWDPEAKAYRAFSGNEIGILLAHWTWVQWRKANPSADPQSAVMLASTVSSKMLAAMAAKEGFRFEETLTGFKWLGNRAMELEDEGLVPLFAFEEAIGFCFPTLHKDKDGVSAAAVFAQMAASVKAEEGRTVRQQLDWLSGRYGVHEYRASYYIAADPKDSAAVFDRLRAGGNYPEAVGPCAVTGVRDLGVGTDSSQPDGKTTMYWQEGDMMITFSGEGFTLTLRASGTEPKLKYYLEVVDPDAKKAAEMADAMVAGVDAIVDPVASNLSRPQ